MCGISGEVNLNYNTYQNKNILKSISHRGPHNSSYKKLDFNVSFYHTRLKIIDLSDESNQPMVSNDGRYTITYNGELYNYIELREVLKKSGFIFKTNGDTEVFLNGFIKYKKKFFELANGIYGVSIYDNIKKIIYFARDYIGVKPLYYSIDDKKFFFSSELKTLIEFKKNENKLNKELINELLYYKYNSGNETLIKNIYKFEPGKVYWIDLKKKKINLNSKKYFNFKEINNNENLKDATLNTKKLLNKSVELQLQSDANVGIQLSGGLDSTLLTEISNNYKEIKHLFCSSFKNYENNEINFARIVSKKLNINLNEIELDKKFFFNNFNKSLYHLDEPINHPHSLAILKISKEAKKKVSVMLAGEGADEIFFGYERYNYINKQSSTNDLILNGSFIRTPSDLNLFKLFYKEKFGNIHSNRLKILNSINVDNKIKKFQIFESYTHLQSLLLRSDKMMMANSIEGRVPFLDYSLFNYAINLKDEIKKDNKQKHILKKILKQYQYKNDFINRKKIGYLIPFNNWLLSEKNYQNLIDNDFTNLLFEPKAIKIIINNLKEKRNIYSSAKLYWLILNLTRFIKKFKIDYS